MPKFKENRSDLKLRKRITDSANERYCLRSRDMKQIEDISLQPSVKKEMRNIPDISQDLASLNDISKDEMSNGSMDLNLTKSASKSKKGKNTENVKNGSRIMKIGSRFKMKAPNAKSMISKKLKSVKSDKNFEDLSLQSSKMQTEKNSVIFKTKVETKKNITTKRKLVKNENFSSRNGKGIISKGCDGIEASANITNKEMEKDITFGIKGKTIKLDKNEIEETEIKENKLWNNCNEDKAFSDYCNVTIPVIGKALFEDEPLNREKPYDSHKLNGGIPLSKRYDLAIERNERRFRYAKRTGCDDEFLKMVDERANMSEDDKKEIAHRTKRINISMAIIVTEYCANILEELNNVQIDQRIIMHYLTKFLRIDINPTTLLYVPHLVHTILFIRGYKGFSRKLRLTANECYDKCHAMFPIPPGYNFETMYTSEMRKFLPDNFNKLEGIMLDYGDVDDILEDEDAEDLEDNSGDEYKSDNLNNISLF